jgi:surface antigen
MDSYANLRMVVGRLLTAVTLISLTACGSTNPYYGQVTTASNMQHNKSLFDVAFNYGKTTAYAIPAKDRERHERCVYFALETLPLGESCKWFSPDNDAKGEVKVVAIYPQGSGSCQVFHTSLWYKGETKNIQDTACWSPNIGKWQFVSK